MKISDKGLHFLMAHEGCELVAYPDPGSGGEPITIGCGHTSPGNIRLGDICTMDQAMAWLRADCAAADDAVNRLVKVPLTQDQFDALVDFDFNEGEGGLASSTLLRLLNAGDYEGADKQFARWNQAAGRVLPGLVTRRADEAAMFEGASA